MDKRTLSSLQRWTVTLILSSLTPKPVLLSSALGRWVYDAVKSISFLDYFVSSLLIRFHQWEGLRRYWRVGRKRVSLSVLQVLSAFPVSKIQLRL